MPSKSDKRQKRQPPNYIDAGLPASEETERLLFGLVLLGALDFGEMAARLRFDDFMTESHQRIFRAMAKMSEQGEPIDPATLGEQLKRRRQLSAVGGLTYLAALTEGTPAVPHSQRYIQIVLDAAIQRAAIHAADAIGKRFLNGDADTDELLSSSVAAFTALQSRNGYHAAETPPSIPQWPDPIGEEAFHGIAGDLVRVIEPHTESDRAALLIQFLIGWGSLAGRGPYYLAEADYHHTNEYAVIVGTTAKGRKGTSLGRIRNVLGMADDHWTENCFISGIGSGEALIDAVSADEHRAMVIESEFARLLAIVNREGCTLSAIVRDAWDTGSISTRTRQHPARAIGAHVSLMGHITREELLRKLDSTEMGNGFGNRILWVCARRSKVLPHGGASPDVAPLARELSRATDCARRAGNTRMRFDREASALWERVYPELSEGKGGLLGAMTSRAEAHVVRLSLMYALLDCAETIREEHLRAALAVWRYCDDSARFIWGEALGDPTADETLRALRDAGEAGLTRWDLMNHFSRKKSASELDRAIGVLAERGLIRSATEETGGRAATRYWAL
jgi:hypothetical protein